MGEYFACFSVIFYFLLSVEEWVPTKLKRVSIVGRKFHISFRSRLFTEKTSLKIGSLCTKTSIKIGSLSKKTSIKIGSLCKKLV